MEPIVQEELDALNKRIDELTKKIDALTGAKTSDAAPVAHKKIKGAVDEDEEVIMPSDKRVAKG